MRARKIVVVTAGKFVTLNNESFLVVSPAEFCGLFNFFLQFINVVFSYVALFRQMMEK